jgi:predicted small metal-binding protein
MAKNDNLQNAPGLPDSDADALTTDNAKTPGGGQVNPFSHGRKEATGGTGGINPSAPTTGTEGWGLANRESKTTGHSQGTLGTEKETKPFKSERDAAPLGDRTFRCADAGNADCRWKTTAQTEDDLMLQVERHGREAHGIQNFDETARRKILNVMRERRAA